MDATKETNWPGMNESSLSASNTKCRTAGAISIEEISLAIKPDPPRERAPAALRPWKDGHRAAASPGSQVQDAPAVLPLQAAAGRVASEVPESESKEPQRFAT